MVVLGNFGVTCTATGFSWKILVYFSSEVFNLRFCYKGLQSATSFFCTSDFLTEWSIQAEIELRQSFFQCFITYVALR